MDTLTILLHAVGAQTIDIWQLATRTKLQEYMIFETCQRRCMSCALILEPFVPCISPMTGITWLQPVRIWSLNTLLHSPFFLTHRIPSEPLDFVHIYDATTFDQSQVIDFFGEIAGVCKFPRTPIDLHRELEAWANLNLPTLWTAFTPDDKSIYIANADDRVG